MDQFPILESTSSMHRACIVHDIDRLKAIFFSCRIDSHAIRYSPPCFGSVWHEDAIISRAEGTTKRYGSPHFKI